jgi:ATP-dependent protease ClpP protease subunit
MSRNWFEIKNKADKAELFLYDEIGGYGIGAHEFITELQNVTAEHIDVHINSVGGEVFQGLSIYQALKDHPATVNVYVDALAASIASVIAMAGDEVTMAGNAQLMIHDAHVGVQGNANDLSKMVEQLNRCSDNIASVYAERCGGEVGDWRNAMQAESWYSADEAVKAGLADKVAPKSRRRARNVADLQIFNYAGREFAPAPAYLGAPKEEPVIENEAAKSVEFTFDSASFRDALKEGFGDV